MVVVTWAGTWAGRRRTAAMLGGVGGCLKKLVFLGDSETSDVVEWGAGSPRHLAHQWVCLTSVVFKKNKHECPQKA